MRLTPLGKSFLQDSPAGPRPWRHAGRPLHLTIVVTSGAGRGSGVTGFERIEKHLGS